MAERLPDVNVAWAGEALFMEGFESALVGLTYGGLAIYDFAKAAEVLVAKNPSLDAEDACDVLTYQVMPQLEGKVVFVAIVTQEETGGRA